MTERFRQIAASAWRAFKRHIVQTDALQMLFSVGTATLCLIVGHLFLSRLYSSGALPESAILFLAACASSAVLAFIIFFIMKWTLRLHIAFSVTLPKVVELSYAMKSIGIPEFDEQIYFITKRHIDVFLSQTPILSPYKENATVKKYINLGDNEKSKFYNGDDRLCLNAEDYDRIMQEHAKRLSSQNFSTVAGKDEEIKNLRDALASAIRENESLQKENKDFSNKLKTISTRNSKTETSTIRRIPFWLVAAPLINRLRETATPGILYSRPDIQAAFDEEVKKFPELKENIKKELHLSRQKAPESEFDLTGWAMEAIRAGLGNLAKTDPGPTGKR